MKEEIKSVIESMLSGFDDQNRELFMRIMEGVEMPLDRIKGPGDFDLFIGRAWRNFTKQFVRHRIGDNDDLVFIYQNASMIENRIREEIVAAEGSVCSGDKSRTVLNALSWHYSTGGEIAWDLSQQYTYHIPKTVFTTHGEVISFYNGIRDFYHGADIRRRGNEPKMDET